MGRINDLRLIARIAQMYHLEGHRQAEIAGLLRLAQATVSRMLKRAEAEGIVRTSIIPPPGTFADLEAALRSRYGLSSWSRTILRMVANVHPHKAAKARYVVQILGGMGEASLHAQATQLTTRLANLTGSAPRLLLVPGVAPSQAARLVMLADLTLRETTDLFSHLSLASIGIGAVEPSDLLARSGNGLSAGELAVPQDAGAAGEISFRFNDKDGRPVETPLNERVIGITLDDLRKAGRVMALAGGPAKTPAIAGALRLGVIDVLVTDRFTAARLTE